MILVAGGTGTLGRRVIRLLTERGLAVRILTRDTARARQLASDGVEIVVGDVADEPSVERAVAGVATVVSAIQGFGGVDARGPAAVDDRGNATLIEAAHRAAVAQFVLLSIAQAAADHPIEHFRTKYAAEQTLRASGVPWTIIRPTAYMETFIDFLVRPLLETGTTRMVGRGDNPINFVSAEDVARFVDLAVVDPTLRGAAIDVPGPENITLSGFIAAAQAVAGRSGRVRHAPVPMMRLVSTVMRPFNPIVAGQLASGVVLASRDMRMDPTERRQRYPAIPLTRLEDVMRRELAAPINEP
ncbi:MAG: SDR family oxidoreductase [Candidatus Limnocylindrales bacterium]